MLTQIRTSTFIIGLLTTIAGSPAFAADCPPPKVSNKFIEPGCDLANNLARLYYNSIPILLWLIILMVIVAGYVYITSGGNAERVKTAKDILGTTMIGAILLIMLPLILDALGLGSK